MTTIYLIRHGQAEGNLYRRCHSWHNGLLTLKGREQVKALEKRFEGVRIDAVYSSDLYRAMSTAGAIYRPRGLTLRVDPGLREIGAGVWEDVPWGQLLHDCRDSLAAFLSCDPSWRVEGSETFPAVRKRMDQAIRRIAAAHPGETAAVVSHGCAIRAALSAFLGLAPEQMGRIPLGDNTSVARLEVENGRVRVYRYNDESHLPNSDIPKASISYGLAGMERNALRFRPLRLPEERELCLAACAAAWKKEDSLAEGELLLALLGEQPAGVLHLDRELEAEQGVGWVSLLWLAPDFCRSGLGVQLLGHAVCTYREMGRQVLRLFCPPDNAPFRRFCLAHGFGPADGLPGVLEKYIGLEL